MTKEEVKKFIQNNLINDDTVKLSSLSDLSKTSDDIKNMLEGFYECDNPVVQKIGTILNAIFTQKTNVFMLSIRILSDLVEKDPNLKAKSCHSSQYRKIIYRLLKSGLLKKIREPNGNNAGLYELIHEGFLSILIKEIGQDVLDAKKKAHIEWYDEESKKRQNKIEKANEFLSEVEKKKAEERAKRKGLNGERQPEKTE